jgi:hypothetical protein
MTMQQSGTWYRMDGLRFSIHLKLAYPVSKQGLVFSSRNLPPLLLGIAGVPVGRLSFLWQGVFRVFAVVCVFFHGTSSRIEI